jgi:hypothetical protein
LQEDADRKKRFLKAAYNLVTGSESHGEDAYKIKKSEKYELGQGQYARVYRIKRRKDGL